MRLRNVKGSREQIAANEYTIKDAEQIKGRWKDYFQDGKPIQLEIGKKATVEVMESEEKWYGVTYKEDKKSVMDAIAAMKVQGTYPENLWK